MVRPALLPAVAKRALPALARSVTAVAVALAAEYALRSIANRALSAFAAPLGGVLPARSLAPAARSTVTRTVVTELLVIEPVRRRG